MLSTGLVFPGTLRGWEAPFALVFEDMGSAPLAGGFVARDWAAFAAWALCDSLTIIRKINSNDISLLSARLAI
jgi:hypothetical protein